MRTIDTIDRELRLLAVIRAACRQMGGTSTSSSMDQLLDERLATARAAARRENDQPRPHSP